MKQSLGASWTVLCAVVVACLSTSTSAQRAVPRDPATVVLTANSTVKFTASPDHNATFGNPPAAVLSHYQGEFFSASEVANGAPNGAPAMTVDFGKPTPDASGTIVVQNVKDLLAPNIVYVLFLSAVGPGGISARVGPTAPFMTLAAARTPPSPAAPAPTPSPTPTPPPPGDGAPAPPKDGKGGVGVASLTHAPDIAYSTYLGGAADDLPRGIAADDDGNAYVAGGTLSADFPTTSGAFQRTLSIGGLGTQGIAQSDAFVTKTGPDGHVLWSTLLGGPGYDRAEAVEVDKHGFVYVAGRAGRGFPVTSGAFQTSFQGSADVPPYGPQDGFVCKLAAATGTPIFCSYFGTSDASIVRDVAVDGSGSIYLAASYTSGTYQPGVRERFNNGPHPGSGDAVLAKITGDGSAVLWAAYLGGSGAEGDEASVRVDAFDTPYLLTTTTSPDALTSAGTFGRSYAGNGDLYLTKVTPATGQLMWATYLGGTGRESAPGRALAVDRDGYVYVAATTQSTDFPTTTGALGRAYGGGAGDIIVAKISADASRLVASTYAGGQSDDWSGGLAIDPRGNVYITGTTGSGDFPVSADAWHPTLGGARDAVVLELSPDFSHVVYATYAGRPGSNTSGRGIAVDSKMNVYEVGETAAPDWSVVKPSQAKSGGRTDSFLMKISPGF